MEGHASDALVQRVDRLVDHRQQDAVDDEGREILGARRLVLPRRSATSLGRLKVASSVAMPRISSTSFITGTGFMKCMPMNFPAGRCRASRVIEIEEVLVARMRLVGFRSHQAETALKILPS